MGFFGFWFCFFNCSQAVENSCGPLLYNSPRDGQAAGGQGVSLMGRIWEAADFMHFLNLSLAWGLVKFGLFCGPLGNFKPLLLTQAPAPIQN